MLKSYKKRNKHHSQSHHLEEKPGMMEGGILLASVSRLQNQTQGSHLGSVAHPVPDFGQVNSPLCAFVSPCTKCITTTPQGIAVKIKQVNVSAYNTYSDWPLVNKAINMLGLFLSVMWIFSVFSLHVYLNRFLFGIDLVIQIAEQFAFLSNNIVCLHFLRLYLLSIFQQPGVGMGATVQPPGRWQTVVSNIM